MQIAGANAAANQIINQISSADKGKTESVNTGASFLSAAREVAESITGKIVVAQNADLNELSFNKFKSEFENEIPEKIDTVYDFIAEIRKILKDSKKSK